MKTLLTRDVPYEASSNSRIKSVISLSVCPFCDEIIEYPPSITRSSITDKDHTSYRCAEWVKKATVWFLDEESLSTGFFMDHDGDWWVFMPEQWSEDVEHHLRPIEKKKLRLILDAAYSRHTEQLDDIKRATGILMNTEHPNER